jgi:hypothetical protein
VAVNRIYGVVPGFRGRLFRHCERSEAIQGARSTSSWIASSLTLLAMTMSGLDT